MVDPNEDTGSMPENTIAKEIKTILKSIGESNMGNLLGGAGAGSDGLGGGVLLGLLLGRSGILGGAVGEGAAFAATAEKAAIDSAVAAALASANQANSNAMLLLKDIQDSSQDVVGVINNASQTALTTSLQGQIANLQGQASILAGVEASKGTIINEVHESESAVSAGIGTLAAGVAASFGVVNTNIASQTATTLAAINADGDKTRALIQSISTADLNRQITVAQNEITELRHERRIADSGVNVTNNINQTAVATANATAQQQIVGLLGTLASSLQHNTNSIVNLGTMRNSGQAATNVVA
jgi:hypothetical protein